MAAAEGLSQFGPEARAVLSQLTRAVNDADAGVRMMAIRALSAIGPAARIAAPALARALDDADLGVRMWAGDALQHLGITAGNGRQMSGAGDESKAG